MGILESFKKVVKAGVDVLVEAVGDVIHAPDERVQHERFHQSTQLDSYSCGVQAVKMTLDYFLDRKTDEKLLKRRLKTDPCCGTGPANMVRVLRSSGLTVSLRRGGQGTIDDICRAIDQKKVVIAVVPAHERGVGHWVCIYGYTVKKHHLMLRDPAAWRTLQPRKRYRIPAYIVVGQKARSGKPKRQEPKLSKRTRRPVKKK